MISRKNLTARTLIAGIALIFIFSGPATAHENWIEKSDLDDDIRALQLEVDGLRSLRTEIESIRGTPYSTWYGRNPSLNGLGSKINDLDRDVSSLEDGIESIGNKINDLDRKIDTLCKTLIQSGAFLRC